jgi:hypothetical protein
LRRAGRVQAAIAAYERIEGAPNQVAHDYLSRRLLELRDSGGR